MPLDYWQGENIQLRAIKPSDIALFQAFDDEISRNVDAIYWPQSEQRQLNWIEEEQKPRNDDSFRWIVENLEGEVVGSIDTFACNRRNGTFKYGLALLPNYRSRGYAHEMVTMVLRFYFHELNYQKVTPHVFSFNMASIKLHEKLGFKLEGQLRSMIFTNGEYYDELYFGMTRTEFTELYGK